MMHDHIDNLKQIAGESNAFDHQDDIHPFLEDWRGQVKGTTPLILFPLDTKHVQRIVQYCNENDIKIVSQGGNTSLCGANVPHSSEQNIEIVVNTSKMNRVIEVDPFNRSMIVESGCILQNIQNTAQDHDLLFPLSLSAEGSCQIGGNISTNAGGVNVLKYGMARDQVMGIEVVLPDGSIFSDLKSLRKDNTGYDLKQLFIGAEGTLGVITKVSLKLASSPINEITSMVSLNNIGDVIEFSETEYTGTFKTGKFNGLGTKDFYYKEGDDILSFTYTGRFLNGLVNGHFEEVKSGPYGDFWRFVGEFKDIDYEEEWYDDLNMTSADPEIIIPGFVGFVHYGGQFVPAEVVTKNKGKKTCFENFHCQ